jgi:hypothetical protein
MSGLLKNNLNNKFLMLSGVQDTNNDQQTTMNVLFTSLPLLAVFSMGRSIPNSPLLCTVI